jgi:hypothetical protein
MSKGTGPSGWFVELDRLLRGESTRPSSLRDGSVRVPVGGLSVVGLLLGALAGACMGSFAISHEGGPGPEQILASAVKVPLLFALTLVVTFPSLYVFNALVGSRLTFGSLLRLLVASTAVMLTVLASLAPILAFFSVVTESYPFILLFNVVVCAVAGGLGLNFLLQTLHRLSQALDSLRTPVLPARVAPQPIAEPPPTSPPLDYFEPTTAPEPPGALDRLGPRAPDRQVRLVFRCWVVLFGLVGAQMAWVLRPFIGNPNQPFTWFRPRQSNFFEAVFQALAGLLGA